jgi:C4-dicarboxylate transporter DctQ subunit
VRRGVPIKIFHRAEEWLLALILAAMTLLTFVQVILRYLFNTGLFWALEATLYMFAWLVLIGISYGVRTHSHIGIDLLAKSLPPAPKRILGLVITALALLYTALMFWGSYTYIHRMMRLGVEAEDVPIERWILGLCLPIGFALLGTRLGVVGWQIATGRAKGFELADEAAEATKDITRDGKPDATEVSR